MSSNPKVRPNIIFVDDDPMLLSSTRRRLTLVARDWDLHFADSGAVALEICKGFVPSAVVTDMRMPGMDGAVLLKEIQRLFPESIRIIFSGQTDQDALIQAHSVAHSILAKPCDADQIYQALQLSLEIQSRLGDPEIRRFVTSGRAIPVSTSSIFDILSLLREPDVSPKKIGESVRNDLGLYAYILKIINSSHFGMRSPVCDIDQAILLLGASQLRTIVCGLKLAHALSPTLDKNLCTEVLETGILRAQKVLQLVQKYGKPKAFSDECYIASLFQDFGKLVLSVSAGSRYLQTIEHSRHQLSSLVDFERETFRCTHAEVGAYLLSLWSFPSSVIRSICRHEDVQSSVKEEPETVEDFVRIASTR